MLKEIIKGYNDSKLALIEKLSDSEEGIYDELDHFDDGYIKVKIKRLQKEYEEKQNEINSIEKYNMNDNNDNNSKRELIKRLEEIRFEMAFLASNNIKNIDSCFNLLNGMNTDFLLCIRGLKYYSECNEKEAFNSFYSYFKGKKVILNHFLINKVYGTMMYNYKQYDMAAIMLRKAAEKRPEDVEVHKILKNIYLETNKYNMIQIEDAVIDLLENGIKEG